MPGEPDTSVKLPAAVVAAAEKATQLANEQRAQREASLQNAENVVNRTRAQMTFSDVGSPTPPVPNTSPEQANLRVVNPNRSQPRPQPQQQILPPEPQRQEQNYTEQQFRSMQGRWEREQEQNRQLSRRLTEMQNLIASMNSMPQPSQQNGNGQGYQVGRGDVRFNNPVNPNYRPQKLVTDDEEKEFGKELIDVMGRRAREATDAEFAGIRGEVDQLRMTIQNMHTARHQERRSGVYGELDREVPDWDQINRDPQFLRWLDGLAPYSGQTKKALLDTAMNSNQADLVIDFFKGYKAELATLGPAQAQGAQPGNGGESYGGSNASYSRSTTPTTPAVDLMDYAAPGRARPGQTQTPPDEPTVSRAEIKQLYDMKKLGKFNGREAEFNRLEQIVFEAQKAGRITP
jgi:hypothetical protein